MNKPTIYHTNGGCPKCGEKYDVEGDFVEISGGYAWQRVYCCSCGCVFYDGYKLERTEVYEEN